MFLKEKAGLPEKGFFGMNSYGNDFPNLMKRLFVVENGNIIIFVSRPSNI